MVCRNSVQSFILSSQSAQFSIFASFAAQLKGLVSNFKHEYIDLYMFNLSKQSIYSNIAVTSLLKHALSYGQGNWTLHEYASSCKYVHYLHYPASYYKISRISSKQIKTLCTVEPPLKDYLCFKGGSTVQNSVEPPLRFHCPF